MLTMGIILHVTIFLASCSVQLLHAANTIHGGEISHSSSKRYSDNITRYYYYNSSESGTHNNPIVYINLLAKDPGSTVGVTPKRPNEAKNSPLHNVPSTESFLANGSSIHHVGKSIHVSRDKVISYEETTEAPEPAIGESSKEIHNSSNGDLEKFFVIREMRYNPTTVRSSETVTHVTEKYLFPENSSHTIPTQSPYQNSPSWNVSR